ncbi:TPM domain-containing protein [Paenibacillus oralis]|uniref:TPM domain-containing protein n=1 Tax=Paenibacillus oralis TaxID=2490856 RepID=A0A3P3TAA3_9BACL|nr:TPM domain-containing protein [Paenibacillus oralis]RRJ54976.1 TPM domain-containing protein [Paenibacillus oralis]
MNKITVVLFLFFLIISTPMTALASVPEKKDYVQDMAHIFPNEKIDEINSIAHQEDSNITFYILTIDTLNGQNSAQYAAEVFNSWGLNNDEALILISKQDHRIEVNYRNTAYLSNVNLPQEYDNKENPNETTLEKLIRMHFVSYAQNEDFSAGVMDFMNTFRNLNTLKVANKEQNKESSSPKKDKEEDSSKFLLTPLYFLGSFLVLTSVTSVGYQILRRIFGDDINGSTDRRRTEQNSRQESTQTTRPRSQRPVSVADALENMLNNNTTTTESTQPVTQRRTNTDDSESNTGLRVIRVDNNEKNQHKSVDNPEAKRIIRR